MHICSTRGRWVLTKPALDHCAISGPYFSIKTILSGMGIPSIKIRWFPYNWNHYNSKMTSLYWNSLQFACKGPICLPVLSLPVVQMIREGMSLHNSVSRQQINTPEWNASPHLAMFVARLDPFHGCFMHGCPVREKSKCCVMDLVPILWH